MTWVLRNFPKLTNRCAGTLPKVQTQVTQLPWRTLIAVERIWFAVTRRELTLSLTLHSESHVVNVFT